MVFLFRTWSIGVTVIETRKVGEMTTEIIVEKLTFFRQFPTLCTLQPSTNSITYPIFHKSGNLIQSARPQFHTIYRLASEWPIRRPTLNCVKKHQMGSKNQSEISARGKRKRAGIFLVQRSSAIEKRKNVHKRHTKQTQTTYNTYRVVKKVC